MTVIEQDFLTVVPRLLKEIARSLEHIADMLDKNNGNGSDANAK